MPVYKIQAPDGKVYKIEGPDEQGAIGFLQQHLSTQQPVGTSGMIEVELPDGTIAEFPDGTSQDVMRSALQKRFGGQQQPEQAQGSNWWESAPLVEQPAQKNWWEEAPLVSDASNHQPNVHTPAWDVRDASGIPGGAPSGRAFDASPVPDSGGYGRQVFSGLLEGATGALGAPVDLVNNFLVKPAVSGVNAVFGTDLKASETPLGGSAGLRQGLAISPESQNGGEQFARRVAQSVGGAAVPLAGTAQTAGQAAVGLATAAGGGMGGATAQQLFPNNVGAEIAGELLGGVGTGAAITGIANRQARKAAEAAVPTVEQLKQQAADKFQDAHSSGVMANQAQTQQLAADMKGIAEREGLISPTGRVSEAYPKAREALRMVEDYAQGDMSVPQMQTARKVLADAAKSSDNAERRISTIMLKQFDDFTSPLAPQLTEGRSLYARAMRGEELETLRELAGSRAGQFTGSGYENALRTEYRNLERRIIKGQERGWTPDQQAAISRVAQGTATSNALRNVGRMAPTGPVSYMSTVGAPGILGTMAGGPMFGAALATGSAMAGYGARAAATRKTSRFADLAEMLVRNGVPINPSNNSELRRRVIEALIGSQSAAQSN